MSSFTVNRNRWKILLGVAGVCLLAFAMYTCTDTGSASPDNLPFETTRIKRGDLTIMISSTGSLTAKGTVEVGTQVSGAIDTISVDYNDIVQSGQILATLNKSLFKAELMAAKASVASARAKLNQARASHDRNAGLNKKGYISDEEFLVFQTNLDTSQASLDMAKASLLRAQTNIDYTVIRSPIDGTVIERSIEEGQTVAASLSTPTLFVIAEDLSDMQIEVDVDESDIGYVKAGQPCEFEVAAYPDRRFTGMVEQIRLQPQMVSNVVTYTVVVEAKNEDGVLLPGMTATVDFIVNQAKDTLLVPDTALLVSLGKHDHQKSDSLKDHGWLYILENDRPPRRVSVTTGLSDGSTTVVSGESIDEGARIITSVNAEAIEKKRGLFSRLMPRPGPGHGGGKR